jgi:hypothetical protein
MQAGRRVIRWVATVDGAQADSMLIPDEVMPAVF